MKKTWLLGGLLAASVALGSARDADAFCGFYVSGADAKLFNDATVVVLMRDGTRTVLSMQNSYEGPVADFALVVPVPVILKEENVKTLPADVFGRVDRLAAPRLVEYYEQDPCYVPRPSRRALEMDDMVPMAKPEAAMKGRAADHGVTIEASFTVGEYDIVILSAKDSTGLDAFLRAEKYKIPAGAEPILRPYVQGGMKFFVAKVNADKVKFEGNRAMLSPLRFHYDSEKFELPIRLGLVNAQGAQDLLVHILAPGKRYQTSNYANVTIPTNLMVDAAAKDRFGELYAALFDRTLEKNPGAVVTEYAWQATSCDPCPDGSFGSGGGLSPSDIMTLGADVLPSTEELQGRGRGKWQGGVGSMVLTRLHARYTKDTVGEDLVFEEAKGITGGRGTPDAKGRLAERGAVEAAFNAFQGRYVILHWWKNRLGCQSPIRGRWGGPSGRSGVKPATGLAFAKRGQLKLASFLAEDVDAIDVKGKSRQARMTKLKKKEKKKKVPTGSPPPPGPILEKPPEGSR